MSGHTYHDKTDAYFGQGRPEMLEFVPEGAHRILEIGCGRGDFIAQLKATRNVHATGVEPFKEAAAVARQRFDVLYETTVDDALSQMRGQSFDCVVFNDVLEHMVDPWAILRAVQTRLAPGGSVVASIPSVRYWPVLNQLFMHADFSYAESGVLDRTHLRFFTQKTMVQLFTSCGFAVERMQGINGSPLPFKIAMIDKLLGGRFSDARYPQFGITARLMGPQHA